jgi:hypothetical protein
MTPDPYFRECQFCGKKFLVEVHNNGTSHVIGLTACCIDCVLKDGEAMKLAGDIYGISLVDTLLEEGERH